MMALELSHYICIINIWYAYVLHLLQFKFQYYIVRQEHNGCRFIASAYLCGKQAR